MVEFYCWCCDAVRTGRLYGIAYIKCAFCKQLISRDYLNIKDVAAGRALRRARRRIALEKLALIGMVSQEVVECT